MHIRRIKVILTLFDNAFYRLIIFQIKTRSPTMVAIPKIGIRANAICNSKGAIKSSKNIVSSFFCHLFLNAFMIKIIRSETVSTAIHIPISSIGSGVWGWRSAITSSKNIFITSYIKTA